MSRCDQSKKARSALDKIGDAVDELKGLVESTWSDTEESEANGIKAIAQRAYDRMKGGMPTNRRDTFPTLSWFVEVVADSLRNDSRACRDMAARNGASQTENEINCRLEKSNRY
jgi:hypothetical protein